MKAEATACNSFCPVAGMTHVNRNIVDSLHTRSLENPCSSMGLCTGRTIRSQASECSLAGYVCFSSAGSEGQTQMSVGMHATPPIPIQLSHGWSAPTVDKFTL
jgi:hypothetical protein